MDPEDDDNDGCERDRGLNCFVDVMDLVGYKGPQDGEENGGADVENEGRESEDGGNDGEIKAK
ncbi:hypothetical protein F4823DRAFT_611751 [Ustulina deusta]|nr:hypothetical protein F4823DRAFT_611751 [Ustulina deusta]